MIDFSSLNQVQQAARSMIQSDLRFLYTVTRHIDPSKSNYIPSLLPYLGVVIDGAEDWVKAVNNSCKNKLPIPQFTRDEEKFYEQIRISVKLWQQDYDAIYDLLEQAYSESDHYFGSICKPIAQKLHCFFNNYSSGLLFKNSFFSKYSLRLQKKSFWKYYFYEITPRICDENTYNGYNKGIMSELAQVSRDNKKLLPFLQQNNDKINVNELELNKIIKMRDYKKLTKKLKIQTYDEYFYGLKTFLDFETELSNFLVHISQINNVFYAYCTKRDSKNVTQNEIEEYKKQLEKSLLELYEDENAKISFKIGFVYLYSMNFALRTEDDDYEKLKYQDLNVSKFKYQNENWEQYRRRNETQNCSIQKYIVERMRNSLMHGHIEILLNKKGEIEFVFRDKYNKRNEVISIILEDLEEFLSQQCLYSGIPKKTLIFRVQQR